LEEALNYVRKDDTRVVWRLDRLGRSLPHLIATMTSLNERQVGFKSLTEHIDTTTNGGKLIYHVFGAIAEFERDIIRERTQAGLTAARAREKKGGRPQALTARQLGYLISRGSWQLSGSSLIPRCAKEVDQRFQH
jgi:DNA invertase Pin-like site-specific DNA recombinase